MFRFVFFLFLFGTFVGLPAAVVFLAVSKVPAVRQMEPLTLADFDRADALLKRFDPRRMPAGRVTTVTVSGEELNTVIRASLRSIDNITSRVDVSSDGATGIVSVHLPIPENPLGRVLNFRVTVPSSPEELTISHLSVGRIRIPRRLLPEVLKFALDTLIGPELSDAFMASIHTVGVRGQQVSVTFEPDPSLVREIGAMALKTTRGTGGVSNPRTVRVYYRKLVDLGSGRRGTSLAAAVGALFALARERSLTHDPVRENQALLLALAMYYGDARFEAVIGEVRTGDLKTRRPNGDGARLNGRYDFVQHFTISAGLTAAGGSAAANLIGEIKEVQDSVRSSGFSFTDLAADRAGVRFARQATADEQAARRFQDRLAGVASEESFFPRFTDLPENLGRAAFSRDYGDIGSPAYRRVIAEIDRRLAGLPLYR